ncbi:hypothetical protein MJ579_20345 [Klebsiella pneumoniae]|nr:hypothetical protein MJ579_20345 [Klebsiella pneumoniae]
MATKTRGVVVAGRMKVPRKGKRSLVGADLGWPLIGGLSQTGQPLRCRPVAGQRQGLVSELAQAQIVVQRSAATLAGKRVLQWRSDLQPDEYWLVDNLPGRLDPAQHHGRRLLSSVERWLELHPAEEAPSRGRR